MLLFFAVALGWILDKLRERAALHPDLLGRSLYYIAILYFAFFIVYPLPLDLRPTSKYSHGCHDS